MPTMPKQKSYGYAQIVQTSPDEKSSRTTTPGGCKDTAFVLQLSSKDFYSSTIQQFLGKMNIQVEYVAPTIAATPTTVTIKIEPTDITPAGDMVEQPKSKHALELDNEPFVPKLIKKANDSDDDLILVEQEENRNQKKY